MRTHALQEAISLIYQYAICALHVAFMLCNGNHLHVRVHRAIALSHELDTLH